MRLRQSARSKSGHAIAIDATTLEANAALRYIVRRDTGETYHAFLTTLAQASGIKTPTRAELTKFVASGRRKDPTTGGRRRRIPTRGSPG